MATPYKYRKTRTIAHPMEAAVRSASSARVIPEITLPDTISRAALVIGTPGTRDMMAPMMMSSTRWAKPRWTAVLARVPITKAVQNYPR